MEIKSKEHQKAVMQALLELRESPAWIVLKNELGEIKESKEQIIFDEYSTPEQRELAVKQRNVLKLFVDMPDDLIEQLRG